MSKGKRKEKHIHVNKYEKFSKADKIKHEIERGGYERVDYGQEKRRAKTTSQENICRQEI